MPNRNRQFDLAPRLKLGVGRHTTYNKILKISAIFCLILASGLAVYGGILIFSNQTSTNSNAPQVLGTTDVKTQGNSAPVSFIEYKVQKGDTLFNVAQKFNISWSTLSTLNDLKTPANLKPGQILRIPK